jgi:hypothetical protein
MGGAAPAMDAGEGGEQTDRLRVYSGGARFIGKGTNGEAYGRAT